MNKGKSKTVSDLRLHIALLQFVNIVNDRYKLYGRVNCKYTEKHKRCSVFFYKENVLFNNNYLVILRIANLLR